MNPHELGTELNTSYELYRNALIKDGWISVYCTIDTEKFMKKDTNIILVIHFSIEVL